MVRNFISALFIVVNFSSCVTYLKNSDVSKLPPVSDKFRDEKLKIYFSPKADEADVQNVELFRELLLSRRMFDEIILVKSEKIEICTGNCLLFENIKSGLSIGEKLNMGLTFLTLGIVPTRFTNEYALKNRTGKIENIELVYWGSLFLVVYAANSSFDEVEQAQLAKVQKLLNEAM
jgi:hypothetical protein